MTGASEDVLEQASGRAFLTVRSVLIGAVMCVAIGILAPYWTFYLITSTLFVDYCVAGAVFLLFVLMFLTNAVVGALWRPVALKPGELVVVAAMMFIAGGITTMGTVGYMIPNITAPYYLAPKHDWEERLWPHLPRWMSPLDEGGRTDTIMKFYYGLRDGESIPWGPWIMPLARWAVFFAAMYAFMASSMVIVRKQWISHERLSYPIGQVFEELCVTGAQPWGKRSILRSRLFWFGFGIPFVIASLAGLHGYFPAVPRPSLSMGVSGLGPLSLNLRVSFTALGFTFLIPNKVVFSLWFLNLVSFAFRSVVTSYRLGMVEDLGIYGAAGYPIMAHQGTGAMIVFVLSSLWFSRRHLKRASSALWAWVTNITTTQSLPPIGRRCLS